MSRNESKPVKTSQNETNWEKMSLNESKRVKMSKNESIFLNESIWVKVSQYE